MNKLWLIGIFFVQMAHSAFLYATPAKNTYRFKDVASYYYSARENDYSDGGFYNLSGTLTIAFYGSALHYEIHYENEENSTKTILSVTDSTEYLDSENNRVKVYTCLRPDDTTHTKVFLSLSRNYAKITRSAGFMLFFDFNGIYSPDNSVTGSGFAVNSNTIITNQHVVNGNKIIYASRDDLDSHYVRLDVIYEDIALDIAVLKSEKKLKACAIDRKIYDIGDEVIAYGFPQLQSQGTSLKATKGIISSRSGYRNDVKTYQIDAAVQPGNSGGPLAKGDKIVGVVGSYLEDSQNVNYAIKSNFLGAVLDVLKIQNTGKSKPRDCTYIILSLDKSWLERNADKERQP